MTAILKPAPVDTDPSTGILRTPVEAGQTPVMMAQPDASQFGVVPTTDAQRRQEVAAEIAALTRKLTRYTQEATGERMWEWNLLRRQGAAFQERAHEILFPERPEDTDLDTFVKEDR